MYLIFTVSESEMFLGLYFLLSSIRNCSFATLIYAVSSVTWQVAAILFKIIVITHKIHFIFHSSLHLSPIVNLHFH